MTVCARTDRGIVRPTNQDAFEVFTLSDGVACAVVCDGMGGAAGGNIASVMAVSCIAEKIKSNYRPDMTLELVKGMLLTAIDLANAMVFEASLANTEYSGMGTTVVAAVVMPSCAIIAHAGDSRAYKITQTGIAQVTIDHSMVQALVERGELTAEQAKSHPQKNLITRAVGASPEIEVDCNKIELSAGDKIFICTDGLSNMVEDIEIYNTVTQNPCPQSLDLLVESAKKNGGVDNITVALAC